MPTEEQLRQRTINMMDVLTRNEANLRKYHGVISLGIGFREKRNESVLDEPCIYIEVEKKLPLTELDSSQVLPQQVENIPVDVVEQLFCYDIPNASFDNGDGCPHVLPDGATYRPLLSGCPISDGTNGVGTAGLMGYSGESSADNLGFVTCKHVLPDDDKNIVYQPQMFVGYEVATVIYRAYELIPGTQGRTQLDIAICKIDTGVKANNQLVGKPEGFNLWNTTTGASLEEKVIKYGRSTRLSEGTVVRLGSYIPGTNFHTEISVIGQDNPNDPIASCDFAVKGDSGAALLTRSGGVLGIICQTYSTHPAYRLTSVNDIGYVKSKLGKQLYYPIPADRINMLIAADTPRLVAYSKILSQTTSGAEFLNAFVSCYAEGRELIMTNKECMVTWIRNSGPEFVMLRKKEFSSDHYNLVKEAGGTTLTDLFTRMFDVFMKHGSTSFKNYLTKYREVVTKAFGEAETMEQAIINLSKIEI